MYRENTKDSPTLPYRPTRRAPAKAAATTNARLAALPVVTPRGTAPLLKEVGVPARLVPEEDPDAAAVVAPLPETVTPKPVVEAEFGLHIW